MAAQTPQGYLCLQFEGDSVQRQLEIVPGHFALLMDRARHSEAMTQVRLGQLLAMAPLRLCTEISPEEFNTLWSSVRVLQTTQARDRE